MDCLLDSTRCFQSSSMLLNDSPREKWFFDIWMHPPYLHQNELQHEDVFPAVLPGIVSSINGAFSFTPTSLWALQSHWCLSFQPVCKILKVNFQAFLDSYGKNHDFCKVANRNQISYLWPPMADHWQVGKKRCYTVERAFAWNWSEFWSIHCNLVGIQNPTKSSYLSSHLFPFLCTNEGKSQLQISCLNILFLVWQFPVFCPYVSSP